MNIKLIQEYTHFNCWECFKSGMYSNSIQSQETHDLAKKIMSNHVYFGSIMKKVSLDWKNTMLNHLSNVSINRKAFLGQCAMMYFLKSNSKTTKKVWKEITQIQRDLANHQAKKIILHWELNQKSNYMFQDGKKDVTIKEFQTKLL